MKDLKVLGSGCADSKSSRYVLEHIKITPEYSEVTDGKILIRRKHLGPEISVDLKAKKYAMVHPANLKNSNCPLIVTDEEISVDGGTYKHPVDVEFPETETILKDAKKMPNVIKICLNKSVLMKLLKALPKGDNEGIIFEIKAKDKPIYFTHNNCEGVILPALLEE
jgi:hypothetical protein